MKRATYLGPERRMMTTKRIARLYVVEDRRDGKIVAAVEAHTEMEVYKHMASKRFKVRTPSTLEAARLHEELGVSVERLERPVLPGVAVRIDPQGAP